MLQAAGLRDTIAQGIGTGNGVIAYRYQTADLLRNNIGFGGDGRGGFYSGYVFSRPSRRGLGRFYHALRDISYRYVGTHPVEVSRTGTSVSPGGDNSRQAIFRQCAGCTSQVAGQLSAEMVTSYPPGIPCLLPGELITSEMIDYLYSLRASGCRVQGPMIEFGISVCDR